jgi:hypothetical protein
MAIDSNPKTQGKETYNFVIYGQNNTGTYNVDWASLLRHYPDNQKFRLKWSLTSRFSGESTNGATEHTALLFIDFGARFNQQDSNGNNGITNMGGVELVPWHNTNSTLRHSYENTYVTITKPVSSQVTVSFRLCDNSALYTISGTQVPKYCLKIEFLPIYDE